MFEGLLKKSADETGFNGDLLAAASKAVEDSEEEEELELEDAAEKAATDADFKADDVLNTVSVLQADSKAGGDDLEEILAGVESGDLSAEEALTMVGDYSDDEDDNDEELKGEDPEDEDPGADEVDDPEDDDDEDDFEEKLESHGVVTEEKLEEKMNEVTNTVAEKMEDAIPTADTIAEKMETGGTESPSSGNGGSRSIVQEMNEAYGGEGE